MIKEKLEPIHPGEVLLEEFLKPMTGSITKWAAIRERVSWGVSGWAKWKSVAPGGDGHDHSVPPNTSIHLAR